MKRRPELLAGEDLPPQPRQQRSRNKRAKLNRAALALFGEKGYEATSIEEIAARATLAVGSFYQHYRSKRQLLLVLMDEFLRAMERLDLRPAMARDVRAGLRELLARGFAADVHYLGVCRAWEEAVLSDADLALRQQQIRSWTRSRAEHLFRVLQGLPGARQEVNVASLAEVIDNLFWSLLAQAVRMRRVELDRWIDAANHLIYHALFTDAANSARV